MGVKKQSLWKKTEQLNKTVQENRLKLETKALLRQIDEIKNILQEREAQTQSLNARSYGLEVELVKENSSYVLKRNES